jgi:hypothetical protein
MQTALRLETTVLPGHCLEITAPELPEGATVEVLVVLPEKPAAARPSMLEFLATLPPGPRASPTWEEYERHLQEEKTQGSAEPAGVRHDISRRQCNPFSCARCCRFRTR